MKLLAINSVILGSLLVLTIGTSKAAEQQYSGFLDDYPKLIPDKDRKGALTYQNPKYDHGKYDKFVIEPVLIWYHPDSKYKGIDPGDLKTLADAFRDTLIEHLSDDYPVVTQYGPGIAIIRVAITDVRAKKKKRGVLGYTPAGLVVSTAMAAAGKNISLQDAALELELLDSQSGERMGFILDRQSKSNPSSKKKSKQKTSWKNIQETFDYYATRFKSRLDTAHRK